MVRRSVRSAVISLAALPLFVLYSLFFLLVVLGHLTLLRLPFFWDEGGYYIPAALDFYHHGSLIPVFTNAHPPLPNIALGTLWHLVGFGILQTRLAVCAVAACALLAVFRLTRTLLGPVSAAVVTLLTAIYPIWYAQSSLAHADIFAAALTLWAFTFALPAVGPPAPSIYIGAHGSAPSFRPFAACVLFSLAALAKETAIVQPLALALVHGHYLLRREAASEVRRVHLRWIVALLLPVVPLACWFGYHRLRSGFTFGNPEYLRYNATANFTVHHVLWAFAFRFVHLFWQRNIWLPLLFAAGCLFLPRRTDLRKPDDYNFGLPRPVLLAIGTLVAVNWLAFSILGGALLTRYLLPVYPLLFLVCVAVWQTQTRAWPTLAAITAVAFLAALWINPSTYFTPEDNLTYRDMIVVQAGAIDYVQAHFPGATILTAWPVEADLTRPELGYVHAALKTAPLEDFSRPTLTKAAEEPGRYDTAIVFTSHYVSPAFRRWLAAHPDARRTKKWQGARDLNANEIAALLGGHVVWQDDRAGEWAAVLRFNRSYMASLQPH